MWKLLLLVGSLVLCVSAYAAFDIWVVVPNSSVQDVTARLDTLIEPGSRCKHYSQPLPSQVLGYEFSAFRVDDRAQAVLTVEEWESRLATIPIEFIRPLP